MKRLILTTSILLASLLSAQSTEDFDNLQNQIDVNKSKIERLQSDVNKVTTENIYLKDVLDIQKPIKEGTADNTHYKVVAVRGDKEKEKLFIEVLVESTDKDKKFVQTNATIVDILGNSYRLDYFSTTNYNAVQYKGIPLKISFGFKNVVDEPKFIKMFEIRGRVSPIGGSYKDEYGTSVQFKDLPVVWE